MQNDTKHQVYAGFFVRLAAFLVDMIIVNAGLMTVRIPTWILFWQNADNILVRDFIFQYSVMDIVIYLLTALYFILMTYYTGSTLGKKLFQIRVISVEKRKMTLFEVAYRETIGRFLSAVVMQLGYLLVIVQKEHRGVHDLLSDTCVIYYHEKKVYVHTQMNYRNMAPNPGYTVPPGMPGNGSVPPNSQGNVPPMMPGNGNVPPNSQGNVPPMMPGNGSVPPNSQGSVPPGYFSAGPEEKVSEPASDTAGNADQAGSSNPSEPAGNADQTEDTAPSEFIKPGEETGQQDVPFQRNE